MKINASLSSVSKSHYCFCLLVCFLFSCCLHTSVHFVRSGLILFTDKRQNIKTEKIKLKESGVFSSFLFRLNSVLKLQTVHNNYKRYLKINEGLFHDFLIVQRSNCLFSVKTRGHARTYSRSWTITGNCWSTADWSTNFVSWSASSAKSAQCLLRARESASSIIRLCYLVWLSLILSNYVNHINQPRVLIVFLRVLVASLLRK